MPPTSKSAAGAGAISNTASSKVREGGEAWNINLFTADDGKSKRGNLRRNRPIDLESRTNLPLIGLLDLISYFTDDVGNVGYISPFMVGCICTKGGKICHGAGAGVVCATIH